MLFYTVMATGCCIAAVISPSHAMPPGMEPERISHYDSEAIPRGIRNDLPPITDPDGTRDTFFYPDGIGRGRVVHLRIPKNYVSSNLGEIPPRHSDRLIFVVIYPGMISVATPSIWNEMHKRGARVPDEEMEVGIERPSPNYLTDQAARFVKRVRETKVKYPEIKFQVISIPVGFAGATCVGCRTQGLREIVEYKNDGGVRLSNNREITDTYIEWDAHGGVTRMMRCAHTDRPSCGIEIDESGGGKFYRLSIDFHEKYINQLREIVDRINKLIDSSVVEIIKN
jgi:hypothetical protein